VKLRLLGGHRRLLFRSYLLLVAGLFIIAAVLDMGFGYLRSSLAPQEDRWLATSLDLIERELAAVPAVQRDAIAEELSEEIGLEIQLLQRDEIAAAAESKTMTTALVDAAGNTSYLYEAPALDELIRLGPIEQQRESLLLRMLPPFFYLSIFVLVGFWLRPLLKDINLISGAAQRFAADYREPLSTSGRTTQLTSLAKNLDDMSSRLSGLLRSQKELIAALSHEMRTPLARIRFALAILGNKDNDKDNVGEQIEELNADVQEIDQLIGRILDYARLDYPDLGMHWQQVPVDPWLTQVIDKSGRPGRDLKIVKDAVIDSAWMDPRLMSLALSNLLANACRYAKHEVSCTVSRRGESYQVDVEDDGEGIPESQRESIFTAFTRIDDSRDRDTGGYGLGLAIVSRIAALHGGTVVAEASERLGGARLRLRWKKPEK